MAISYPLTWPLDSRGKLIAPNTIDFHFNSYSRSGGPSMTGMEQIIRSPSGRWEAKMSFPIMDKTTLLNWRGFIAAMQGRLGTVQVPIFEAGRQPWPSDSWGRLQTPERAIRPALSDTAYATDPVPDAAANIWVAVAVAAAVNATSLSLQIVQGGTILPGHRFSINGTLYEVMNSTPGAPGYCTVDIRPWLRVAVGVNYICEFRAPVCTMRLASDIEGTAALDGGRYGHTDLNLVESL